MVILFFCLLGSFLLCHAYLRIQQKRKVSHRGQKATVIVAGLSAWSMVVMLLVPLIDAVMTVYSVVALGTDPSALMGPVSLFCAGCFIVLILYRFTQFTDTYSARAFFVQALQFRGEYVVRKDLFVELEKKKVAEIHREQTGRDLVMEKERKEIDPEAVRRELLALRSKPFRTVGFDAEMSRLASGESVDISDSWNMQSSRSGAHAWYGHISGARITPAEGVLSFRVDFPGMAEDHFLRAGAPFRFKQEVYDFLQILAGEPWLAPYLIHARTISFTCCRNSYDEYGRMETFPFFGISVRVSEIRKRGGEFFDIGKLDKIAVVAFEGGLRIAPAP